MVSATRQHNAELQRSFAATYAMLERPKVARRAVFLLLAIHTGLLAYSAYVHSPTLNEPGHLVAGLSYWKFGRFDVYNVNPPLVKMVAALPVMAVGYEEDWSGFSTGLGARPEFAMGEDLVAANGERSFFLLMIARWACIPFSWLGGLVCYLWARDLFGRPSGVIACAIWCFEPNILAHASLITSDAAGTALGLAACYTFWRWLKHPTWSQAAITGVVLGLAELTKTTLILFYPLWPLMWLVYRWSDRHAMHVREWIREAGMLVTRMLIGLYVLNLGYGFEESLKPLGEFRFVSDMLTEREPGKRKSTSENGIFSFPVEERQQAGSSGSARNRFANSWLAAISVPLPKNYLQGIDLQQRDFEDYGRSSYLRGEWHDRGWWYYYLYATAIKVPLGLWVIGVFALIAAVRMPTFKLASAATTPRDLFIILFPPLVVFCVVSSKTGFNEHFRYVLPCFPFIFVFASGTFRSFLSKEDRIALVCDRLYLHSIVTSSSLTLLLWSGVSSIWIYPHSLSYFNEAVRGPLHGPEHLLGSNFDWGQDLRYLLRDMRSRTSTQGVQLAYYGGIGPAAFSEFRELFSAVAQDNTENPTQPTSVVISQNLLSSNQGFGRDADGTSVLLSEQMLTRLRGGKTLHHFGYSIREIAIDAK